MREPGDRYGGDDGDSRADYYSATCVAKAWGCSVSEALIRIREQKPNVKKRRLQQAAFAEADKAVAAAFPAVTKGERRPLAVDVVRDDIAPWPEST